MWDCKVEGASPIVSQNRWCLARHNDDMSWVLWLDDTRPYAVRSGNSLDGVLAQVGSIATAESLLIYIASNHVESIAYSMTSSLSLGQFSQNRYRVQSFSADIALGLGAQSDLTRFVSRASQLNLCMSTSSEVKARQQPSTVRTDTVS